MKLLLFTLFLLLLSSPVQAEVYRYIDENGTTHYVTSKEAVPAQFRDQVDKPHNLPEVSKTGKTRFSNTKRHPASSSKKVEIFVTEWCHYCRKVEEFLKANKIRYTRLDIEKNASARRRYKKLGLSGVPATKVGKKIIRGANTRAILDALR